MTKYRILLVDDSPFMRKVFSDLIAGCGMFDVVAVAGDGEQAVRLTRELAPDVVVMDLEMPKMNGIEALRQIMAVRPTPVIMMSAVTENGARDTIRALQSGAFDFVRKPDGAVGLDIHLVSEMLCERLLVAAETSRRGKLRMFPPAPQEEPPDKAGAAAAARPEETDTADAAGRAEPVPPAGPAAPEVAPAVPPGDAMPAGTLQTATPQAAAPQAPASQDSASKGPSSREEKAPAKRTKAREKPEPGMPTERPADAPGAADGSDTPVRALPARSGKRPTRQAGKAGLAGTAGEAGGTAAQPVAWPSPLPRAALPPASAPGGDRADRRQRGATVPDPQRLPGSGSASGTGGSARRRTAGSPTDPAAVAGTAAAAAPGAAPAPVWTPPAPTASIQAPAPPAATAAGAARTAPPVARPSAPVTRIVAIGTSTGGPRALHELLTALPADFAAPILIVQHMPPRFTRSLAQRLDEFCRIRVREAEDGDPAEAGTAYIAPGGMQMTLVRDGPGQYRIRLTDDPPRNGHKPSVDVLFESLVGFTELERHAVLMTGMGSDGARGMKRLKEDGATTIAESEATCVVYGMPRSAVELGAAMHVLPLPEIAQVLIREVVHGIR